MKKTKFKPVIKWSGSKRSQAYDIVSHLPDKIETYYEPFVGGGSVLMGLMLSGKTVKKYVCGDINKDLISLWIAIRDKPLEIFNAYSEMWHEMNDEDDDKDRKREYFYGVRSRYNEFRRPEDFMFVMRTTTNGMPRYNQAGEFNNSFHITRNGILPNNFKPIILFWSEKLRYNNVQFIHQSFDAVSSETGDSLYLDPPYAGTKGMYFGGFENANLWDWIKKQKGKVVFSYDGRSGKDDNTFSVPDDVYREHKYLKSGNSSFKRTIGKDKNAMVYESLYIC